MVTRHTLTETSRASRAHLLVVDDNPANQKVAVLMLEKLGHRVDVAGNGIEAVDAVSRVAYDRTPITGPPSTRVPRW